jgi:hypothetical protein
MDLDFGWTDSDLTRGLFTTFRSLAEANRITDELEVAAGLQREVTAHQVWQGDELVISNVHSQLHVALSSSEAERVALEVPLLTEFEHMDLGADEDGPATAWAESDLMSN